MKNRYVVSFIFSPDFERVWLIEKQRPAWQKGYLNGIGGKIEEGESAFHAAHRELHEEAGIQGGTIVLKETGRMAGTNNDGSDFEVIVFAGVTDLELIAQEDEQIASVTVGLIRDKKYIENVPALMELCMYHLRGNSKFTRFDLDYSDQPKRANAAANQSIH